MNKFQLNSVNLRNIVFASVPKLHSTVYEYAFMFRQQYKIMFKYYVRRHSVAQNS